MNTDKDNDIMDTIYNLKTTISNDIPDVSITVNDKTIKLTEEQLEDLGLKKRNPFKRARFGEHYNFITATGNISYLEEGEQDEDNEFYNVANYCTDDRLLKQRAMHETLERLLWRYACENGELSSPWVDDTEHYRISYDNMNRKFNVSAILPEMSIKGLEPYFPSKEIAERAITEVIMPFKAEHPDFIW